MLKAPWGIETNIQDLLSPTPFLPIYTVASCWLSELDLYGEEKKGQEKEKFLTAFAGQ